MKKNIIIFAPHQDDEVIGCGGIIQKLISNQDNVYLAIATQSSGIIKNIMQRNIVKIVLKSRTENVLRRQAY